MEKGWTTDIMGISSNHMEINDKTIRHRDCRKTAIPIADGVFSEHFGGAREFLIYAAEAGGGKMDGGRLLAAPEHKPGALPKWLAEQEVDTVVVSAIGERALVMLAEAGIVARLAGTEKEPAGLAAACFQGRLLRVNRDNSRCAGGHHEHGCHH
jgi:predicted Fe-Mo cluster-binding NifX family protein